MNLKFLIEKLEESDVFKDFKKENPDAQLCAGFFILDFKEKREEQNLDYKIKDKIATFSLDPISLKGVEDILDKTKPLNELDTGIKIELEKAKQIIDEELVKNKISNRLEKIIAVLQMKDDKPVWNITCMLSGMKIMIVLIDAVEGKILKFENKSLFDLVRPMK